MREASSGKQDALSQKAGGFQGPQRRQQVQKDPAGRWAYLAPLYNQAKDVAWDYLKQFSELDKEPAIVVRKPGPAAQLTPQNDQLMSECHVLCFKPALRLEWRGQEGQDEAEQWKHYALTLGDSFS